MFHCVNIESYWLYKFNVSKDLFHKLVSCNSGTKVVKIFSFNKKAKEFS